MAVEYEWRGEFNNRELRALHAEAFGASEAGESDSDLVERFARYSLGWVVARHGRELVGFLNVPWDGGAHAWLQDVMVAGSARKLGIGTAMVEVAGREAREAGCQWLHVDFAEDLGPFYYEACGFRPTSAGLIALD
jgi:GNAT superfamily N-acetyltransferase